MVQDRNTSLELQDFGQSIWLDFLRRNMLENGDLQRLISEDGLRGMTSNPSIFEKAIAGSHDYDRAIHFLALEGKNVDEIYQTLTVEDVHMATDLFRPVYDRSDGVDGFVSLEVSPRLAHDTQGTIAEARRLWEAVSAPNLMIKVPGTQEGLPAIRQLISEGINVNVTLLFGLPRYRMVAQAFIEGLTALKQAGKPIQHVASVASFFLSRIDVLVDAMLEKIVKDGGEKAKLAAGLRGQVAIASARAAYQIYKEIFTQPAFKKLAEDGGRPQRLLWASTSTKNPAYSDVKYIEALIGPHTVNTVPLETLNAYRDHGQPAARLEGGLDEAHRVLDSLSKLGIDIDNVTQQLEDQGVDKFIRPFDQLMETLKQARLKTQQPPLDRQELNLGDAQSDFRQRIQGFVTQDVSTRLWNKDPSLWSDKPKVREQIQHAMGWLNVAEIMTSNLGELEAFCQEVSQAGFRQVVHMGMGGSSLAPLVMERSFDGRDSGLPLTVLDTTDPLTVAQLAGQLPLEKTLFIVASKSGTTAEPHAFGEYFYHRLVELKGERAGENFVAISDPETPLVKLARQRGYRRVFPNFPDIGGRYSALSYFGLTPAILAGVDVGAMLERAGRMMHASAACVKGADNPGLALGAALGELAKGGRDKVTFLMPAKIASLGMWLEQLLAESTGKQGRGLVPVAGESLGKPAVYGGDRVFILYRLAGEANPEMEKGVAALQAAGQPVIAIHMDDPLDLGQEFVRWEIAVAVAGMILEINPFDQPNVQESKDNTNRLLEQVRREGSLPEDKPTLVEGPLSLYAEKQDGSISGALSRMLGQAKETSYLAMLAYLPEEPDVEQALQTVRLKLRDRLKIATTLGYGPRYLHSTGQLHKGGPDNGLYLLLTAGDQRDVPIPDEPFTFGVFKRAQALGDMQSLQGHGRRVARLHLGDDLSSGLKALQKVIGQALQA